ncbi:MAG: hypothetical protein BJBARM5_0051 [Candidatus Parvarchaeum acidophilus ARMAN-5]|uniref:Uncharacterized protein n=1 Tax=Candidatus Parvarchaeum acidophilus ARMAN-5 TaxID=662762 RepID=D6GUC4_PARA5|nr:MAG: hypothetical protein BJBARM5_0051 [Candidatus Parvarchaeum acidophilus ARMAN-5]
METKLDFKKFKNLDDLVREDYLNGISNYNYSVIADTAGLLTESSKTVKLGPFGNTLLVKKETIEKRKEGVFDFLKGLKYDSLLHLNNLMPLKLYIFDDEEYDIHSISHEYANNKLDYTLKKRELKEEEIEELERLSMQAEPMREEREASAKELYKLAKLNSLLYEIKNSSNIVYNDENQVNPLLVYLVDGTKKFGNKPIMDFDRKKLHDIYKSLGSGRLFVKKNENEIYSLELKNEIAEFKKHEGKNDEDSIIMNILKEKNYTDMYE